VFDSSFSANVILAKARAMYGKSLKAKDYTNLLNCHSISEIASYLKNNTGYASVLSEVNEATIHRGHLEMLLRRKLFNDYASLVRYDRTVGMKMSKYLIQRAEIELIISCIRHLVAGRASQLIFSMLMLFSSQANLNLALISKSKTYAQLLDALKHTMYHDILIRFPQNEDGKIRLTEIETALYEMLTKTVYQMIRSLKGSAQVELKNLYGTLVDVQNVTRILRLKRYFSAEPDFIRNNLLPYANIIPANVMERMIYAPDADAVMDIFLSTAVGRRLPKSQLAFEYDLHQRVPYFTARRHIHYSIHPAVVLMSYIFIMDIELDDIINIIEGIRYGLQPEEIKPMLVLANY